MEIKMLDFVAVDFFTLCLQNKIQIQLFSLLRKVCSFFAVFNIYLKIGNELRMVCRLMVLATRKSARFICFVLLNYLFISIEVVWFFEFWNQWATVDALASHRYVYGLVAWLVSMCARSKWPCERWTLNTKHTIWYCRFCFCYW